MFVRCFMHTAENGLQSSVTDSLPVIAEDTITLQRCLAEMHELAFQIAQFERPEAFRFETKLVEITRGHIRIQKETSVP